MAGSKNLWIEIPPSVAHANTAVLLTGSGFPDVFWDNVEADGADIIIYDNAGNKLTRQLVAINTAAKTMELYVKSPSSATQKTFLRMNYDDAAGAEVNDFADYEDYYEQYSARVAASADDARHWYNGANWSILTNHAENTLGYAAAGVQKMGFGLRFLSLNIPQYSKIVTSYVTLTGRAALAGNNANARITGCHLQTTFSNLADYIAKRGTIMGGANDDNITTAQVDWDIIAASVIDETIDTPSLVPVVQELSDTNTLVNCVLFIDDCDDRSTHAANCYRTYQSYDGSAAKAPLLTVNYIPLLDYAVYTNDPITRRNVPRIARLMLAMHG